jgi:cellulose synthase operon protein YhjQ
VRIADRAGNAARAFQRVASLEKVASMHVIAFVSGKGGVGKSTLAANVAVALSQRGRKVLAIDLDPQNSLRLHLGMDPEDVDGLVREGISPKSVFDSPFGTKFIPFGRVRDSELAAFTAHLQSHPRWVAEGIESLDPLDLDFVILDTPPGPTPFLTQALQAAHRIIVVVLPDAASYATLPQIAALAEQYTAGRSDFRGIYRLINQMPTSSRLGHQVRAAMAADYAGTMVPVSVHRDPRVSQALAYERPVLEYEPGSMASLDIQYLTDWLLDSMTE